jgi:hypothetical protein
MLCLVCLSASLPADTLDRALALDQQNHRASATVQDEVDGLDDERQAMLDEYLQISRRIELLRTDNQQLQTRIDVQQRHLDSLNQQMDAAETTRLGILPLMERMQQVLGEFVDHDLPFLPEERQSRLARLSERLQRPGVSDGERFQQLLEAYQVELEYGRTIEAYQGALHEDGEDPADTRTLAYFRLGRTGLYYLSLDGLHGAVWNRDRQDWDMLDRDDRQELGKALRIARQQSVPELLSLPVPAPADAREPTP